MRTEESWLSQYGKYFGESPALCIRINSDYREIKCWPPAEQYNRTQSICRTSVDDSVTQKRMSYFLQIICNKQVFKCIPCWSMPSPNHQLCAEPGKSKTTNQVSPLKASYVIALKYRHRLNAIWFFFFYAHYPSSVVFLCRWWHDLACIVGQKQQ